MATRTRSIRPIPIGRVAALLALVIASAGTLLLLLLYLLARQSLPDYAGSYEVHSITHPVRIIRDAHAVPHIYAESDEDAFFALGYAHAQDRLWQMLLNRATIQGRISERLGDRGMLFDRRLRVLDLAGAARRDLEALSPSSRRILESYAAGVNARLDHLATKARGRGAPELLLFGRAPVERWQPADSIGIIKLMALRISAARGNEILRAKLELRLPPDRLLDLLPESSEKALLALPSPEAASLPARPEAGPRPRSARSHGSPPAANPPARDPLETALVGGPGNRGASMAFAAGHQRTATGLPLLATDPHLMYSAPSIWYLAHVELATGGAIGATIPGLPAVVIGRNPHLGWGLTHAYFDDQDLYLEQLDPADPSRYRTPDGWKEFETRTEQIFTAGEDTAHVETIRRTRNGVVLPADLFGLQEITPAGHVITLRWTATDSAERTFDASLGLMRAQNLAGALNALTMFGSPTQNVTLATQEGVGITVAGRVPLRHPEHLTRGVTPAPGWETRNEWRGYIPFYLLPRAIRPASSLVANANNRQTEAGFPYHGGDRWPPPYRIRRLTELLTEREFHTQQSFQSIQNDDLSVMARSVLPLIAEDLWADPSIEGPAHPLRAEALTRLRSWNARMDANAAAPLIFAVWMERIARLLASDEIGDLVQDMGEQRAAFIERVYRNRNGASIWCDVQSTPRIETCREIAARALDSTVEWLEDEYGGNLDRWHWGRAHPVLHRHLPLGHIGPLGGIVNITHESGGGTFTLQRNHYAGYDGDDYAAVHGAGFRAIYNFAQLSQSQYILATGQSGHFLSPHYDDLSEIWRQGGYITMSLDPDLAHAGNAGILTLTPTGP